MPALNPLARLSEPRVELRLEPLTKTMIIQAAPGGGPRWNVDAKRPSDQHGKRQARLADDLHLAGRKFRHPGRNSYGRSIRPSHDVTRLVMDLMLPVCPFSVEHGTEPASDFRAR